MDIHIKSEGCDDPNRPENTCGFAYITVNRRDYSLCGRGYNVVVVDGTTGKKKTTESFSLRLVFSNLIQFGRGTLK